MTVSLNLETPSSDSSTRRSLSELSLAVAKSKRIVVITGAGISCSCGIPDFRSSNGLYALVKQQYPNVVLKGRDLFDASLFRDPISASVFYTFISELKKSIDSTVPSPTHRFIQTLDVKKKLLRSYTQNIDGLEARAGLLGSSSQEAKTNGKGKLKIKVKDVRNVQLHGDIHRVRCTFCAAEFPCLDSHLEMFKTGTPPNCPECIERSEARVARSARPLKIGTLRPAIVLYDESHPLGEDIGSIQTTDMGRKPDMLIIMGTSLKVHGLKKLVKDFARVVHGSASSVSSPAKNAKSMAGKVIFVNRTPPGGEWANVIDYHIVGDTDKWVDKVVKDWKKMRPADWEIQKTLVAGRANEENIPPPTSIDSLLVSPLAGSNRLPKNSSIVTPSSPSKRRQGTSHYCDAESSPSKRRDVSDVQQVGLLAEERGLLFGDNTNTEKGELVSAEGVKTGRGQIKSRTIRDPPGKAKLKKVQRTERQVWVEIG